MKAKSSAHYQREYRRRLREQGLVKKEVWVLPENAKQLLLLEKKLRVPGGMELFKGEKIMKAELKQWTTSELYQALAEVELFTSKQANIELINGTEPSIYIEMNEFGDLPVFLTVSGQQIVVESLLWSTEEVNDVNKFNQVVLKTHKYFPLSTISLDQMEDGKDYYQMFGALSSSSLLENIVLEIEVLASNVIQATEAYDEFLVVAAQAS